MWMGFIKNSCTNCMTGRCIWNARNVLSDMIVCLIQSLIFIHISTRHPFEQDSRIHITYLYQQIGRHVSEFICDTKSTLAQCQPTVLLTLSQRCTNGTNIAFLCSCDICDHASFSSTYYFNLSMVTKLKGICIR